jgi:hypothetical protein
MEECLEEKAAVELPQTLAGLDTDKQLGGSEDNLAVFISNIVVYCREVESKQMDQ